MSKLKIIFPLLFIVIGINGICQQLPFYTQHNSTIFMLNPGSTGTKRLLDARLNYRQQWVGYEGAPRTISLGINSRLYKGKMGAGLALYKDDIGPIKKMIFGGSYAYHIQFPDCELSIGIAGNGMRTTLAGDKIFLRDSQDPAIDQSISNTSFSGNGSFGVYLYNDRFHLGVGVLQPLKTKTEFYKNDTTKKGIIKDRMHMNVSLGYNYSENSDFIWQNSLFSAYIPNTPLIIDYTLLLNYKERIFAGFSIRLGDATALHVGVAFLEDFQVSYSYDFLLSKLRTGTSGSHEITLVYSTNFFHSKRGKVDDRFLSQKYGYLF